ncbi:hypothetical protein CNMCM7927_009359 [Aspergillus lentulus]|nr:hypothetical protein CNMCM7927_009359 [Aspergillus lentulus]
MQDKWRQKVVKAMDNPQKEGRKGYFRRIAGKYALFFLAFITVSCEGIEAVVFVAGVSFSAPATAVPLPVIVGLIAGCIVGWLLYKGGFYAKLQFFLVIATCVMYLVASGIFARSIWYFEQYHWNRMVGKDVGELGAGLGSYDISRSVWHINLMAEVAGGSSTEYLGGRIPQPTAQSYLITSTRFAVPIAFIAMRFHKINGHWRLMRPKTLADSASGESPEWCITGDEVNDVKNGLVEGKVEFILRRSLNNKAFGVPIGTRLLYSVYWSINLILTLTNVDLHKLSYVAKRLGWISVANFILLVFLALRNTPLAPLSGRSYDKLRPLHKTAGYTCITTSILHGIVYLKAFAQASELRQMCEIPNLAGGIAGLAMVFIGLSTIGWFARRYYEVFYIIHLVMFMLILILIGMHRPRFAESTVVIVIVPACLWGSDRLFRFVKFCWNFFGNHATVTPMENGAVRVKLHRSLRCTPGSHAFLWMPSIRFLESHPFTLVSNDPVEFLIRKYDGYTYDLFELAQQQPGKRVRCSVDGGYGRIPDFTIFDRVILVAGGSGASFTFALALGILKQGAAGNATKTIDFIWTVKHSESLNWFEKELQQLQESPCVNLFIHVSRDVTSEHCSSLDLALVAGDVEKGNEEANGRPIPICDRRKGRPDTANLLASCISQCSLESRIGVGVCGPIQMIETTRAAIYQCTYDNGPSITLHAEVGTSPRLHIASFAPH